MTLSDKIEAKIEETLMKAQSIYHTTFQNPAIDYSLRGACAGQFVGDAIFVSTLRFNLELCKANENDFISQTVPHEVAHYISRKRYGYEGRGHGREWKTVMMALGLTPKRCHDYDVSIVSNRKRIPFTCGCGKTFMLTSIRAKRYSQYFCKACKSKLIPKQSNELQGI